MANYNLFLDDFRSPRDAFNYTKDTDYLTKEWVLVRSFEEFKEHIFREHKLGNLPELISFDHDHGAMPEAYDTMQEKTGYHCAQWLVGFCMDNELRLPAFKVHSMNPVGKKRIQDFLTRFADGW